MSGRTAHWEKVLRTAVRQYLDEVVQAAEEDAARLERASGMEKNQLRNVLNVAEESRSLAVLTNFIRYQMGRSRVGPAWQHEGFGLQVIEQIESPSGVIARQAERVLQKIRERHGEVPPEVVTQVRYELARHYLGYLYRAFCYGKETQRWDDLHRMKGEK